MQTEHADIITRIEFVRDVTDQMTFTGSNLNSHVRGMDGGVFTSNVFATGAITNGTFAAGAIDAAAIAANAITAAKIATGAIDADALATDAVTEIQSGLSTLDAAG